MVNYMKKKYHNFKLIIFFSIFIIFLEVIFLLYIFEKSYVIYRRLQGVVVMDNVLTLVVDDKELNMFYSNNCLFLNNKKMKYTIRNVNRDVLKRNDIYYHEVFLNVKLDKKSKVNDVLDISLMEKNDNLYKIFKIIWGDG